MSGSVCTVACVAVESCVSGAQYGVAALQGRTRLEFSTVTTRLHSLSRRTKVDHLSPVLDV